MRLPIRSFGGSLLDRSKSLKLGILVGTITVYDSKLYPFYLEHDGRTYPLRSIEEGESLAHLTAMADPDNPVCVFKGTPDSASTLVLQKQYSDGQMHVWRKS